MRRALLWVPLGLFLAIAVLVAFVLHAPTDTTIRSQMIGQRVPQFALPPAVPSKPALSSREFGAGRPRILNVFASWCVPCIAEAPQLMALARAGAPIDAIAIRDRSEDVADFLARHGDPFRAIGDDRDSRVQLALGSSGVPETFVIDGKGVIRFQHIGPITEREVPEILAAWQAAR